MKAIASHELSETDLIYVLEARMAFQGVQPWDTQLERLLDEEFEACCPQCDTGLLVAVGSYGFFVSAEDYIGDRHPKTSPIEPADPVTLTGVEAQLYTAISNAGALALAERARYVFGTAACTVCGERFDLPAGISRAFSA